MVNQFCQVTEKADNSLEAKPMGSVWNTQSNHTPDKQRGWEEKRDVMWIYPQVAPLPVFSAGSLAVSKANTDSDLQKAESYFWRGQWNGQMSVCASLSDNAAPYRPEPAL